MQYHVYIMSNYSRVIYIGMTSDLLNRVYQHKTKTFEGFTNHYHLTKLVYFEETNDVHVALNREKYLKGLLRKKKIALIESMNPEWKDLSEGWL